MLAVIQSAFTRWPPFPVSCEPLDHLRWKLHSHPRSMDAHVLVEHFDSSTAEPTPVGVTVRFLNDIFVRGEPFVAKMGADNAVPPAWRGRGVSWQWETYSAAHLNGSVWDIDLSFRPHHPASRHRIDKIGQTFIANRVVVAERSFGLPRFLAVHGRTRNPQRLGRAFRYALHRALERQVPPKSASRITVRRVDRFDTRVDALAVAARAQFAFIYGRGADYLNWRHADPRGGTAVMLTAEHEGELVGYAVVRRGFDLAHLADLLAHPDHPETIEVLLAAAVRAARAQGAPAVRTWLAQHHPYWEALHRQGFLQTGLDTGCYYIPKYAHPTVARVLDDPRASIHITPADADWV